ncbi:hypothetical protein BDA99DRAFT_571347 [Phascolomyces articulosus]|uniref:Uncharacterized protein n=1 Tax=Phascolomyces articulosus TaxID=60185 RepID=A0AAD5KBZ9_9FUNG|nr:hypothetical protein BDA99DRAFT_571347 [Phascolomyces articulosus]
MTTTQAIPLIIHHPTSWTTSSQQQTTTTTSNTTTMTTEGVVDRSEEEEEQTSVIVVESNGEKVVLPRETAIAMPEGQHHHSRCNSVVPPNLNATEGGRERAALATVFGVQEYTESNTFWERYQEEMAALAAAKKAKQQEELLKKKKNALQADAHNRRHNNTTTPSSSSSAPTPPPKKHVIARKPVPGSSSPATAAPPLPPPLQIDSTSAAFKPLPDIPNVSKFNDFLIEDEHGTDLMFPASPSSVLLHTLAPAPSDQCMTESSARSSILLIEEDPINAVVYPPKLFIGYPPAIFDMLKSDEDERIIVWGPDPTYDETMASSPTTLSDQESILSSATISKSNNSKPSTPSIQGFSTNATAHNSNNNNNNSSNNGNNTSFNSVGISNTSYNNILHGGSTGKRRSNLVNSARMSAQSLFADGINRLSRQKSLPTKMIRPRLRLEDVPPPSPGNNNTTSGRSTPRLLKRASFTMKHRLSDEELRPLPPAPTSIAPQRVIEAASVEKLVEKLTNSLDYTLMTDFFLTYRTFISPTQLCKLLILRFRWALESDRDDRRVVRIRTFVVMRHWLLNYFVHDFIPCRELRVILTTFLNSLPQYTLVQQSPRDQRIVRGLKKVVRSLKTVHYGPQQQQAKASDLELMDKSTWVESSASATQANPLLDGLRNSVLGDDNASLDSDLSPGNSEVTPEELDQEPVFSVANESTADWSSEDQAMAKLQYERRRREEEEERQRAEFFTSSMLTNESSDILSLVHPTSGSTQEGSGFLSSTSDFMLNTPTHSAIVEKKQQANKRPQLPSEYIAAMTHAAMLKAQPQEAATTKAKKYIPATIIHDMNTPDIDRHIRRIPSSKWCKATPEENPTYNKNSQINKEGGATEQQLQQGQAPAIGLARKLSRKSIERRKSEKNLRDVSSQASSSVSSSAVSTPRLQSADSSNNNNNNNANSMVPELPPLPPATDLEAASAAATALSFRLNQQQQQQQQPSTSTPNKRLVMMMPAGRGSFEALPYDTMPAPSPEPTSKQGQGHKRKLSRKLSKIFKQQQQSQQQQQPSTPSQPRQSSSSSSEQHQPPPVPSARNLLKKKASFTSTIQKVVSPSATTAAPEPFVLSHEECSSKLEIGDDEEPPVPEDDLFMRPIVAPALDTTSHSSDSNVEVSTPTTPNQSTASAHRIQSPSTTLGRIAAGLRDDDDDEDTPVSIGLRRSSSTIENHMTDGFFKRPATGPIYLSHLVGSQPFGFESDAAVNIQELDDGDSSSDDSDDDDRTTAIMNNKRGSSAGLSRGISLSSNIPKHIRTMSLIVEPDRLGELTAVVTAQGGEKQPKQKQQQEKQRDNETVLSSLPPSPVLSTSSAVEVPVLPPKPTSPIGGSRSKSFILLYPANKLVQQLCLIERQVLFGVEWEELVDCRWRDGIAASGGVQRLIQRFNAACQWVVSEIVTTESFQERVEVIRRFIRLAQQCKTYANFATLLQILLGLQSPAVSRLHSTWAQVGAMDMRLLDQLSAFTSPMKNWKNIRDSMTKVAEEFGDGGQQHIIPSTVDQQQQQQQQQQESTTSTTTSGSNSNNDAGGCIPFLGIYLSDLVFNSELPPYIEPVKNNTKTTCDSLMLQQPLVNFRKHRITATVIKRVLTFQNLARRYPFTPEPELFKLCLELKSVDTETSRKLSHDIES